MRKLLVISLLLFAFPSYAEDRLAWGVMGVMGVMGGPPAAVPSGTEAVYANGESVTPQARPASAVEPAWADGESGKVPINP